MGQSSDIITVPVIPVSQPIGTFYVGKMKASDLVDIGYADIREVVFQDKKSAKEQNLYQYMGIQRQLNARRMAEIREYVQTVDACFPNAIIVSIGSDAMEVEGGEIRIRRAEKVATIIDGQHRLSGFTTGLLPDFELIVTIFVDMELEEQAYLFSTINVKQVPINHSLATDLLDFSRVETPEKVAHNLAKAANSEPGNPWYRQIKMLGLKDEVSNGTLTQHTFTRQIVDLVYPTDNYNALRSTLRKSRNNRSALKPIFNFNPDDYPLWENYLNSEDAVIKKIVDNYFQAVKKVFPVEWGNPNYILSKTTGYRALMMPLREFILEGKRERGLEVGFFVPKISGAKQRLGPTPLVVEEFGIGETGAKKLYLALFGPG